MHRCRSLFVTLLCSFVLTAVHAAPKVLLVVSSEGRDAGKTRPGFELDEFAKAWLTLRANGLEVEVASPAGGAPEPDRHNPADDHIQRMQADAQAITALQRTRRTQDLRAGEHAAVLVIGGNGAMFDLPRDAALQRLLVTHFEGGGVLAAVCHGPAALVPLRSADGTALVAGRRITGFTDEEEAAFVAMLGYHQFKAAMGSDQQRRALSVMELGEPHLPLPGLRLAMAQAHIALGNPAAARTLLNAVLAGRPDKDQTEAATRLLQGLPG